MTIKQIIDRIKIDIAKERKAIQDGEKKNDFGLKILCNLRFNLSWNEDYLNDILDDIIGE